MSARDSGLDRGLGPGSPGAVDGFSLAPSSYCEENLNSWSCPWEACEIKSAHQSLPPQGLRMGCALCLRQPSPSSPPSPSADLTSKVTFLERPSLTTSPLPRFLDGISQHPFILHISGAPTLCPTVSGTGDTSEWKKKKHALVILLR